jgi:hypothetical protein
MDNQPERYEYTCDTFSETFRSHFCTVNLDARTEDGSVKTDLPVQVEGKLSGDKLKGTVNGGGSLLKLQTSGGNIEILKR